MAIRTLVIESDESDTDGSDPDADATGARGGRPVRLSLGVGGAITADSVPQEEYEEIRTKAFGVLSALGSDFPGN